MDKNRPAVVINAVKPVSEEILSPVLWGLEEEGIPAQLREAERLESPVQMAKRGADDSPLNVGISIDSESRSVVLHHRDLPIDEPLFVLADNNLLPPQLRLLGLNAARLVKGEPLSFQEETSEPGDQKQSSYTNLVSRQEAEQLVVLATRIVLELLKNRNITCEL
jgi:hypothetical protein